jgi:hypothetical protein
VIVFNPGHGGLHSPRVEFEVNESITGMSEVVLQYMRKKVRKMINKILICNSYHMEISSVDCDIQHTPKSLKDFSEFGFGHWSRVERAVKGNMNLSGGFLLLLEIGEGGSFRRVIRGPTNSKNNKRSLFSE